MTIKAGDTVPSVTLQRVGAKGPEGVSTDELFRGKKVMVFGVPGAFTPTCSANHLPGYIEHADTIKSKGVDEIICLAVNDAFVMGAWSKDQNADGKVSLVADGDATFTKAAGLELDLTGKGLGLRCERFAMLVDDGVVKEIRVDAGGKLKETSADAMMSAL